MTAEKSNNAMQEEFRKKLLENVEDNDLTSFKLYLKGGANPYYLNGHTKSIFQIILSTSNRAEFLKSCFEHKNKPSEPQKDAINYAVKSLHFPNVFITLYNDKNDTKKIVNHQYESQTPLNYLAKKITKENFDEVSECMELLLHEGASVTTPDEYNQVPLDYVMGNEALEPTDKYELIYILLRRYKGKDIPSEEAWKYIENEHMERHLRLKRKNFDQMLSDPFESKVDPCFRESCNYLIVLLERSKNPDDKNALKVLLETLNINSSEENKLILINARDFRNVNLFKEIISHTNFRLDDKNSIELTTKMISEMPLDTEYNKKETFLNDVECFKLLIKSRHVDISGVDQKGEPLLSFAAKDRNETAVKLLLDEGAYLGVRSNYKTNPTSNIKPEILEEHFDSCITIEGGSRNKNIAINLKNICHPPTKTFAHNDMRTISRIKKSTDLQHLLTHPVVSVFLAHKWQLYTKFFYIHFLIYCIYLVLITTYIIYNFPNQKAATTIITYFCFPFIIYLLVRELIQVYIGWLHYVKSIFVNTIDILIIVFSTLTCLGVGNGEYPNIFATSTLLFSYCKLILLMSLLPIQFISMPLLMLIKVVETVLKSGILFVVIAVFGLCFYTRFGESKSMDMESTNTTDTLSLNFNSIPSSLTKITIMSTGEYDASNMIFKSVFDVLLIITFVIVVGISLFNLMTAQAVNDIQIIQDQAEIIRAIHRVNFLNTCEEVLKLFRNEKCWPRWILQMVTKPKDGTIEKITIRQYRYPYEMTTHTYDEMPDIQNSTTIEMDTPKRILLNKIPNKEKQVKRECRSVRITGDQNTESELQEPFLSTTENKPDKENKNVACASSQGGARMTEVIEKIKKWLNQQQKLLLNEIVDTKTVQRAVQIAEQNSTKLHKEKKRQST